MHDILDDETVKLKTEERNNNTTILFIKVKYVNDRLCMYDRATIYSCFTLPSVQVIYFVNVFRVAFVNKIHYNNNNNRLM